MDKDREKGSPRAPLGMLLGYREEVDLDTCCLIAEAFRPASHGDDVLSAHILVHGMSSVDAEAACTFFHDHADILVDVPSILGDLGAEDASMRIVWTDDTRGYLATVYEYGLLAEMPPQGIVRRSTWESYVAYAMSCRNGEIIEDARVRRLMEFDLLAQRKPASRVVFFANMIADVERVHEDMLRPVVVDVPEDQPTLVVCAGAKAEEGKPNEIHRVLASPLPLMGEAGGVEQPAAIARIAELRRLVPWMKEAVDLVEEGVWLSHAAGRRWTWVEPILMHGPSGSGKTHFASMLASALGVGFADVSIAGSTDNRMMEGTALGWSTARPSWPAVSIANLRCANPLLFVDEIEKVDSSHNGDPRRTLLRMLDRRMAASYLDPGLGLPCDLSQITWMFAANEVQGLDTAFLDRVRVVKVAGPSIEHLPVVVEGVVRRIAEELGVPSDALPGIGDVGMRRIEDAFRERRSMRAVAREVRSIVVRQVVSGAKEGRKLV